LGDQQFPESGIEIVEDVPEKQGVERRRGILQVLRDKTLGASFGSALGEGFRCRRAALVLGVFIGEELGPIAKKIVGGNAKAAIDEEAESGLPRRTEIEKSAAAQAVETPQKFLETIGNASDFVRFRCSIGTDGYDMTVAVRRLLVFRG